MKSSILGIGTYLGDSNDKTDLKIYKVLSCLEKYELKLIDTAPNYRDQRSEKIIGKFLSRANRNNYIISSKVGFLPTDNYFIKDYDKYFEKNFIERKIISKDDVYGDWQCFSPEYIKWQLNRSLKNLKTNYLDILFLHNPEEIRPYVSEEKFNNIISEALNTIDTEIKNGRVKSIGISSWNGFIGSGKNKPALNLENIIELYFKKSKNNALKYLQIPFSFVNVKHLTEKSQIYSKKNYTTFKLAKKLNLKVISNAPFLNGSIFKVNLPKQIYKITKTDNIADASLKFAISNPLVDYVLMGTTNIDHLKQAIKVSKNKKMSNNDFIKLFKNE